MPITAAPASAPVATTGSTASAASSASRLLPDAGHAGPGDSPARDAREEEGVEDAHHDGGDGFFPEPVDNDDPEPPPGYQTLLWPTSSLTLTEAIADLKKGLAQLQPLSATSAATRTSTAAPTSHAAGAGSGVRAPDMSGNTVVRTALGQVSVTARAHDEDAVDTMSRGPLTTRADDAVDSTLFRVPPRFAMPVPPPSTSTARAEVGRGAGAQQQAQPGGGGGGGGARTGANALSNSLTARRLVQLTGPGGSGSYQTHQVAWSLDGVVRPHGMVAPVGPGGNFSFTGLGMGRGGSSVTNTLAGSLHGGVNVLLGGAMLSGLILLVFFICYCCQRSARKSDAHFRTQYWLPDPDGPLEVFTLDGQRAGAVLLPSEPLDALVPAPSPPPAYHTVVSLPPLSKPADGGGGGGAATPSSCCASPPASLPDLGADLKGVPAAASACALSCELDADGLPTYEAALKLESQGHM